MCQRTNCEMDFLDVLQWVRVVCDAPSAMGDFVRRGGTRGQHVEVDLDGGNGIFSAVSHYAQQNTLVRFLCGVVGWLRDERAGDHIGVEGGGQEVGRGFGV